MLIRLKRKLDGSDPGTDVYRKCEKAIIRMKSFEKSVGWTQSFKSRKAIDSTRGVGEGGFFVSPEIEAARVEGRKRICTESFHDLTSTDDVARLYCLFSSRALRSVSAAHSYKRVKDRLTAVPTIFADGSKTLVTIIGKARRARSVPRKSKPLRDLNVFQMKQKSVCNTKGIWTKTVEDFEEMGTLEGQKLKAVLEKCSAHLIIYTYNKYEFCFLPPILTYHLQPVDACVGRFFKCICCRPICHHGLRQVDKFMEVTAEEQPIVEYQTPGAGWDGGCKAAPSNRSLGITRRQVPQRHK